MVAIKNVRKLGKRFQIDMLDSWKSRGLYRSLRKYTAISRTPTQDDLLLRTCRTCKSQTFCSRWCGSHRPTSLVESQFFSRLDPFLSSHNPRNYCSAQLICNLYYDHKIEANLNIANLVYFNPFPAFSSCLFFSTGKHLLGS